jgi:hypothetical protein
MAQSTEQETETATEAATEETTEAPTTEEDVDAFNAAKRRSYYAGRIWGAELGYYPTYEDGKKPIYESYSEANKYAVYDVDGDGKEELLLSMDNGDTASMLEEVFEYDVDSDTLNSEIREFPSAKYYTNGIIMAYASHNQSPSIDFWPCSVYRYDAGTDTYVLESSVSAWDKSYQPGGFPDSADTDGDGVVYTFDCDNYVNQAEYDAWYQSYFEGAEEINIPWKRIIDEEYKDMATEFSNCVVEKVKSQKQGEEIDIGVTLIENGGEYTAVENELISKLSVTMTEEDSIIRSATYDGKRFYYSSLEDATSVVYTDEKIDGVTLFGVYPGMPEGDANAILQSYGLFESLYGYKTGDALGGSYRIYLQVENGVVVSISIGPFGEYVG